MILAHFWVSGFVPMGPREVWITTLGGLDSVEVPHETAADFSPAWAGGKLYFLSGRGGPS